ncbi:hypothetical protein ACR0ST_12100 [Aliidiomarina sp. Khilg15.8]
MWLANLVGSVPFKIRLALVIALLVVLFILSGPVIVNQTGFFLLLIFLLFFDKIISRTEHIPAYSDDIVATVTREGNDLVVGGERIAVDRVKRVAVGVADEQTGYLQFPFNPRFKARYTFPAEQTPALRTHLQTLLPHVTLVE